MDSKFKSFLISLLRRGTFRWKPRIEAKLEGRKQIQVGNKLLWHYTCATCGPEVWYRDKDIYMDHIVPVVSDIGFETLDIYAIRMFPPKEGWQRLCEIHHKEKTTEENLKRKLNRKLNNQSKEKKQK